MFFFKQKTAYEMRISDWSSDVCSSDLLLPRIFTGQEWRVLDKGIRQRARALNAFLHEIGRASCRERVCQYGVDLGGRRIIKKKTFFYLISTFLSSSFSIHSFYIFNFLFLFLFFFFLLSYIFFFL